MTLFEKASNQIYKMEFGKEINYYKIENRNVFMDMVMFFSQINNRIKTKKNFEGKSLTPNKGRFGLSNLYQYKLDNQMGKWMKI